MCSYWESIPIPRNQIQCRKSQRARREVVPLYSCIDLLREEARSFLINAITHHHLMT
uniref:Uncharacterized protein n=1 Tax=Anguilla anguilla TaxID=7936 RepID=A0A0E9RNW4_ANGAN